MKRPNKLLLDLQEVYGFQLSTNERDSIVEYTDYLESINETQRAEITFLKDRLVDVEAGYYGLEHENERLRSQLLDMLRRLRSEKEIEV